MEKIKDPNVLTKEELIDTLHTKMIELNELAIKMLSLQHKHNGLLDALLVIKETYPHVFEECITEETMNKILGKE